MQQSDIDYGRDYSLLGIDMALFGFFFFLIRDVILLFTGKKKNVGKINLNFVPAIHSKYK